MHDHTQALPVQPAFAVPATTCPVTNWTGTDRGVADRLDVHHLRELRDAGWEVASHTVDHATLGGFEFLEDAEAEDTRTYPEHFRHGHHEGRVAEITDGERTVYRTLAGNRRAENDGRCVELEEPPGQRFLAGETVIRYPAEEMIYQLEESKRHLGGFGFPVDTLLAPYDHFGDYAIQFVPEYDDFVANGSLENHRINVRGEIDPDRLSHRYFIDFPNPDRMQGELDVIAESGAFGVLGVHTFEDEVYEDPIRDTLEWIEDRGIEVRALRDGARRFLAHQD